MYDITQDAVAIVLWFLLIHAAVSGAGFLFRYQVSSLRRILQ